MQFVRPWTRFVAWLEEKKFIGRVTRALEANSHSSASSALEKYHFPSVIIGLASVLQRQVVLLYRSPNQIRGAVLQVIRGRCPPRGDSTFVRDNWLVAAKRS